MEERMCRRIVRVETRPQNTRIAESTSHGKVARKRYKGTHDWGNLARLGQGWTTGHQNRTPAARKHPCSTSCHGPDRIPSSNTPGMSHPITPSDPATQTG